MGGNYEKYDRSIALCPARAVASHERGNTSRPGRPYFSAMKKLTPLVLTVLLLVMPFSFAQMPINLLLWGANYELQVDIGSGFETVATVVVVGPGVPSFESGGDVFYPGTEHWYADDQVDVSKQLAKAQAIRFERTHSIAIENGLLSYLNAVQDGHTLVGQQKSHLQKEDWEPLSAVNGELFTAKIDGRWITVGMADGLDEVNWYSENEGMSAIFTFQGSPGAEVGDVVVFYRADESKAGWPDTDWFEFTGWQGGQQDESSISCGETIYVSTELDSNLIDCPGDGIIIGADGIELRLNGYIVDGDEEKDEDEIENGIGTDVGIRLVDGVKVKIKGPGVVREFHEGILVDGGNKNEVKDVVVADNSLRGIHALNSSKNKIKENTVHGNGFTGIQISGGSKNQVDKNDAHGNTTGIFIGGSDQTVRNNNSHGNSLRGISVSGDKNKIEKNRTSQQNTGIAINPGADGNIVKRNNITDNDGVGVLIQDADDNDIMNNTITNSFSGGVSIHSGTDNVVKHNTFSNNDDQIYDTGIGTVVVDNICHPVDLLPVCN